MQLEHKTSSVASRCPDEETILAFVRDGRASSSLSSLSSSSVEGHVLVCAECRALVAELVRGGQAGGPDGLNDAPERFFLTEAPATLAEGEIVGGRYRIVGLLGRGGMGEVYRAQDELLGEAVALKTLVARSLDDPGALARLKNEVLLARQVSHPNVCRLLEFGLHGQPAGPDRPARQLPYLTMELLIGESLARRLGRCQRLPAAEVRAVMLQVASALAAVHAAGIVHRDIKCDNLFVVPEAGGGERVVITDLGLARRMNGPGLHTSGFAVGTFDYMAPEQLEGAAATPAFDLYAAGVVMHELLTGRRPRPGGPRAALRAPWRDLVAACLEADPGRRMASATALRRRLEHVRAHRPLRWTGIGAAAAAAGLIAALAGAGMFARGRPPAPAAVVAPPPAPLARPRPPAPGAAVREARRVARERPPAPPLHRRPTGAGVPSVSSPPPPRIGHVDDVHDPFARHR
jgi:eukaryotic-like serine/threonine-protein kinase